MANKPIKCDYCERDDANLYTLHLAKCDRIVALCPDHRHLIEELKNEPA